MAMNSISSASSGLASGVWAQLQQQQAQRAAEQAEVKARALKSQAADAQATADQAQERARTLSVESDQAQSDAGDARQDLATMRSLEGLQSRFSQWGKQLSLRTEASERSSPSPVAVSVASTTVNALGQTTGAMLSVTA
jgi:hypothetical protein